MHDDSGYGMEYEDMENSILGVAIPKCANPGERYVEKETSWWTGQDTRGNDN